MAEKLIQEGAIPITFSDSSGNIYEPSGFDEGKLRTMQRIKQDRGARVGRYILASTSARFNDPENVFAIPCDLAFPCASFDRVSEHDVALLAANGCQGIIEGTQQAMSDAALVVARKKGEMTFSSTHGKDH